MRLNIQHKPDKRQTGRNDSDTSDSLGQTSDQPLGTPEKLLE